MAIDYITLLALSIAGFFLFKKINLPAPTLIGPMVMIAVFRLVGVPFAEIPDYFNEAFQIIIGVYLGIKIQRQQISAIKHFLVPSVIVVGWTLLITLGLSFLLHFTTDLNLATSFFGAAPGGLTEMVIMAMSFQAEVPVVALFQLIRMAFIVISIPLLVVGLNKEQAATAEQEPEPVENRKIDKRGAAMAAVGVLSGVTFLLLGFPAGGLIGAAVGTGAVNVLFFEQKEITFPDVFRSFAELGLGTTIGMMFSPDLLSQLATIAMAAGIFFAGVIFNVAVLTVVLHSILKKDWVTSLLCAAPGGISQMIIVAESMDKDSVTVSYFQFIRLITVLLLIPLLFQAVIL